MADVSTIMRERQRAIRRELDRRGIALKAISYDSGIPYSTLLSYFPGQENSEVEKQPAVMPAGALYCLCGAVPPDLLNLMMPDGWAVVRVPSGVDYDEVSHLCRDLIDAKDRAHHPESEAGRDIGPNEAAELDRKVARLRVA